MYVCEDEKCKKIEIEKFVRKRPLEGPKHRRQSRSINRTEVICIRCDDLNINLSGSGYDPVTFSYECGCQNLNISHNIFCLLHDVQFMRIYRYSDVA
jgi:hypothetical protein